MKTVLKLEDIALFGISIWLFSLLSFSWWWYLVLFFLPDLGCIGYIFNTKIGALFYNVLHHKGVAILLFSAGSYFTIESLQLAGVVMFGHAAFDRVCGYGLKYNDSFKHTHLGYIGKSSTL
ncbi:DUF4260 domain-containing protein [Formosa algae]|uniref:DUF4260 domain-containing protein n=1 Tax=Formosa algae TaxID=225843 RepID=A0A9X1C8V9_9FLAO|nr:DUF4260 domain-containing protein [Formosa algae]MBP1839148.1 hypothetical protein [Formosa algae]MDQ0333925.1 hypothetical protein [Formosa algae]OEI79663.1 hypothetical protein AST99_12980 [Formosa algae]